MRVKKGEIKFEFNFKVQPNIRKQIIFQENIFLPK